MERTIVHIVGGESRSRAEQARKAFALDHHAEVYSTIEELLDRHPGSGVILAAETGQQQLAGNLIELLANNGVWLPIVITSPIIQLEKVVAAIQEGALDYLALPLETSTFARRLNSIIEQAEPYLQRQRLRVQAANRIACLSPRERQVLELLSAGLQNKDIAQNLQISPRTVEIHRSNMMRKLHASHPADAVKAWLAVETVEARQGDIAHDYLRRHGSVRPGVPKEEAIDSFRQYR